MIFTTTIIIIIIIIIILIRLGLTIPFPISRDTLIHAYGADCLEEKGATFASTSIITIITIITTTR